MMPFIFLITGFRLAFLSHSGNLDRSLLFGNERTDFAIRFQAVRVATKLAGLMVTIKQTD